LDPYLGQFLKGHLEYQEVWITQGTIKSPLQLSTKLIETICLCSIHDFFPQNSEMWYCSQALEMLIDYSKLNSTQMPGSFLAWPASLFFDLSQVSEAIFLRLHFFSWT
jgi:hypothetical protein